MSTIQIIGLVFLFLVAVVPVLGVTLHLLLKPTIGAILRLHDAVSDRSSDGALESRMAALENEVLQLRGEIHRLNDGAAFSRALGTHKEPEPFDS